MAKEDKRNPSKAKSHGEADPVEEKLALGMQKTREVGKNDLDVEDDADIFSPPEMGNPDSDPMVNVDNPFGVEGIGVDGGGVDGRGPLAQEGEGNRQNDEMAELDGVEPDFGKKKKR